MQSTRQKIVDLLKDRGQATVEELADVVGLTPMAVRHHLNVLCGENLIVASSLRRTNQPGRPQQLYALTEAANKLFPEDYFQLAGYLLDEAKAILGTAGLEALMRRVAHKVVTESSLSSPPRSPEACLDQLMRLLGDQGFTVRWEREGKGYVIRIVTCPYRRAARLHNEVCLMDRQIIEDVLDVEPSQLTCMAHGDRYCTYHIRQPIKLAASN